MIVFVLSRQGKVFRQEIVWSFLKLPRSGNAATINSYFSALLTPFLASSDYLLIYRPISSIIQQPDMQKHGWHLKTFIYISDNNISLGLTHDWLSIDWSCEELTQLIMTRRKLIDCDISGNKHDR